MEKTENKEIKFGMFGGVFTPSVLTVIGVVLFLRTGWLVGNTGLLGALVIILIAHTVTTATGLSLSSITTNIRIGAGGAYSIIARSLGLEVGGAIGIPLYLSQAISAAFYIAGFTEAWINLFPEHPVQFVAASAWAILAFIAYIGAHWAIRVQYVIMAAIAVSLASFFIGNKSTTVSPELWGNFPEVGFWTAFAIFFPAVTGIMSGVSMSGDLKDPRKAIPKGTMLAIGIGFIAYIGAAFAYAFRAGPDSLLSNSAIMIDISLFGWTFYLGVFAATLSSALGALVAAPRTLYALGEHGVIPFSGFFAKKTTNGQPRNAVILTSAISLVFILAGTLDTIAQLLTMFFLITYGMVNLVTFIEMITGIVSFRPSFKVPAFIPLYGFVACIFIMILISPFIGVLAILVTAGLYAMLARAGLQARWGDVRSGLFSTIAGWAATQAVHLPRHEKSWTPDILLPLEDPKRSRSLIQFARDICHPGGGVIAFSVTMEDRGKKLEELDTALIPIRKDKLFFISSVVTGSDFVHEANTIIQVLQETFFRPNVLLLTLSDSSAKDIKVLEIVNTAIESDLGIAVLKQHSDYGFGERSTINVILRDRSPNKNLAILLALQLHRNWNASHINLVSIAEGVRDHETQTAFFANLKEDARLPQNTTINVMHGHFPNDLANMPPCDIAIFGMGGDCSTTQIRKVSTVSDVTCLFIRDSGYESVYA